MHADIELTVRNQPEDLNVDSGQRCHREPRPSSNGIHLGMPLRSGAGLFLYRLSRPESIKGV